jgi:hypothetical protein
MRRIRLPGFVVFVSLTAPAHAYLDPNLRWPALPDRDTDPRSTDGYEISATVDQTLLAPTILGMAGIPRASWMTGTSLQSLTRGNTEAAARTCAFTQYFAGNSVFRPITRGTVGVVDGRRQYVLNLPSGSGALFDLAEAHQQKVDLSSTEPATAVRLRERIQRQFPEVFGATA